jgi:hypothetical protein
MARSLSLSKNTRTSLSTSTAQTFDTPYLLFPKPNVSDILPRWDLDAYLSVTDSLSSVHKRAGPVIPHLQISACYCRERKKESSKLLWIFINDVHSFRQLMRTTGCILVGNFATSFFTETALAKKMGEVVEIFFPHMNFESSLRSWFAFFKEESKFSSQTLYITTYEDDKVCSPKLKLPLCKVDSLNHVELVNWMFIYYSRRTYLSSS